MGTLRLVARPDGGRLASGHRVDDLAVVLERHEEAVWDECVSAAADIQGNPLGALVSRGPTLMTALTGVDRPVFNRVITLGVGDPATPGDVDRVVRFYGDTSQHCARVEVSPAARPSGLADWLTARGFAADREPLVRMWRSGDDDAPLPPHDQVRLLGPDDRDAVGALGVRAWGALQVGARDWFGATVGRDGFRHFGIADGGKLVSVGAMCVIDGIAWVGFDATHPRYRGRGLRLSLLAARIEAAARLGCRDVHGELTGMVHPALEKIARPLYAKASYTRTTAPVVP